MSVQKTYSGSCEISIDKAPAFATTKPKSWSLRPFPFRDPISQRSVPCEQRGSALQELGSPAVYITDKFREVVHRFDSLPSAADILGWIEFTAMQCPECHPPEWPPLD